MIQRKSVGRFYGSTPLEVNRFEEDTVATIPLLLLSRLYAQLLGRGCENLVINVYCVLKVLRL